MSVGETRLSVGDNEAAGEIDLGGLSRLIVAKRKWIIAPTLLALAGSTAFVNIVKPRYTAETRVLLEPQDSFTPRIDKSIDTTAATIDAEAVGSQIQLMTSRDVARRAIKSIGLLNNPEFDPLAGGIGPLTNLLILAGLKRDPTQLSPEDRVFENYYEKLSVYSPTKTRILTIEFQSRDPDLAAKGANTIADIYIDYQQEAKRAVARSAATSLAGLVADLKGRLAIADEKAEAFRAQSGLLMGANNTSINAQQLGEVNTELSRARTTQADAQAKALLIRDMLRQGRISEVPDVANNDLVRRISEQRVSLRAQLALESRTLLSGHPRIKELQAQLGDLDIELRLSADKAARTLENESKIAGSRVENLQSVLDQQKKLIGASGIDEVQLRDLDRVARVLREELDAASVKYQEAVTQENSKVTSADARVVSRALAPQTPTFPKKLPIIGFSTFSAFVFSIGLLVAKQLASDPPRRGGDNNPKRFHDRDARDGAKIALVHDAERLSTAHVAQDANPQISGWREVNAAPQDLAPGIDEPEFSVHEADLPHAEVGQALEEMSHSLSATVEEDLASAPDTSADLSPARPQSVETLATAKHFTHKTNLDVSARARGYAPEVLASRPEGCGTLVLVVCDGQDDRGFCLALARRLVREGRAIFIALDGAPRVPGQHAIGFNDLLTGEATFSEVIHRDTASRLHLVAPGPTQDAPQDELFTTLDALKETYDFVVVGVSYVLDTEDAGALAQLATNTAVFTQDLTSGRALVQALEESGVSKVQLLYEEKKNAQVAA